MCQLFAQLGYQGPINFDASENEEGQYEFIGDCNPRLSAIYPNLAVRDFFRKKGIVIKTIANLGYRGRIPLQNYAQTLHELKQQGSLFSSSQPSGVLTIPSFTGENRFDFWFLNWEVSSIKDYVYSNSFQQLLHSESCDIQGIYF